VLVQHVNNLGSRTGRQEPELHGSIRIGIPEWAGDRVVPCGCGTIAPRCRRRARCRPYCPLGCGSFLPMPLYLDDGSFPPMPTAVEPESASALGLYYPCERKRNRGRFL
jgi:hypothetical protein